MTKLKIPVIDIEALFSGNATSQQQVDDAIGCAAYETGFMTVIGYPQALAVGSEERAIMLKMFDLPEKIKHSLWKSNFAPENENLYRGLFPFESHASLSREGFEFGPDIVRELPNNSGDLLYEATPLPDLSLLPEGWLDIARKYYLGMEEIGYRILASLSRTFGIDESIFRDAFNDGISTLRLLHYKPPTGDKGLSNGHIDSGLLTVLAQCGVEGLQARDKSGDWIDVPPRDDGFAINFGGLLECWTGGRVKATEHRVLPVQRSRNSVPFFFEPRPSTLIEPLPMSGVKPFEPFLYGDHLWAQTTKFPENLGLGYLRPARGPYTNPLAEAGEY